MSLNIYKSYSCEDSYSKNGTYNSPVFEYPSFSFDGREGQTRTIEVFLKNDGVNIELSNTVNIIDDTGTDESSWIKVSLTEEGLSSATPGASLSIGDLDPSQILSFWIEVAVPALTETQIKHDLSIQIVSYENVYDFDVEIAVTYIVSTDRIEIYFIGEDEVFYLDPNEISISNVRLAVSRGHGMSQISNVSLSLSNIDNKYDNKNPSSIFYQKQIIGSFIRIKTGWGQLKNIELEVIFQGKIDSYECDEKRTVSITAYDAINDIKEYSLETDLTINTSIVATMNPVDIIEYVIKTLIGIQWFNFDTLTYEDILDDTLLATAYDNSIHFEISQTTYSKGTRALEIVDDILRYISGDLYTGRDGKLYLDVQGFPEISVSPKSFDGNENSSSKQITSSKRRITNDTLVNQVIWKYSDPQVDADPIYDFSSKNQYGVKPLDISIKLSLPSLLSLQIIAERIIDQYKYPIDTYDLTISYIEDGIALKISPGEIIEVTDPALYVTDVLVKVLELEINSQNMEVKIIAEDAASLLGKFFIFSSEEDEGDGLGITSENFSTNWKQRFWFFGNADSSDPHYDGASNPGFDPDGNNNSVIDDIGIYDNWGNWLESNFVFW